MYNSTATYDRNLRGHDFRINHCAYSPDGTLLVTVSDDKTGRIWNALTGGCLFILQEHTGPIVKCVFSSRGATLATASRDGTAIIWDVTNPSNCSRVHVLLGHAHDLRDMHDCAMSPDDMYLATAAEDVRIWDVITGTCVGKILQHMVCKCAYVSHNELLLVSNRTSKVWNPRVGTCLFAGPGQDDIVTACALSHDGSTMVIVSDRVASMWNTRTHVRVRTLTGHADRINNCVFSPNDTILATTSSDKTAKMWDTWSGGCLCILVGHAHLIHTGVFYPDGSAFVTMSADTTTRIWSVPTGVCLYIVHNYYTYSNVHYYYIHASGCVVFTSDGAQMAIIEGHIGRIWNVPHRLRWFTKILIMVLAGNRQGRTWLPPELWRWITDNYSL